MTDEKCVVPVPTMSVKIAPLTANGGEGTSDYNALTNKPKINGKVLLDDVSLEEIGAQPTGDYALKSDVPDTEGIKHDIENLTELYKELADEPEQIYVGYISSITPGRDAIEKILEDAIKSGASTLILRPTTDLPQDFTAISSGPNLQKYKNGGSGTIKFTDVNEHTTINAMPSVISYVTTVSFSVTAGDEIDVTITDVTTKFISGINSTSQQAYVIHTKNEEAYTPTKDYHPAVKKTVDDAITTLTGKVLTKDNTTEYTPTTDYNPATKKYVDDIDVPTLLSQLTNDLLNESDSRENALQASQQNPGKFYFWGGEE